jgi:hypothetical protein
MKLIEQAKALGVRTWLWSAAIGLMFSLLGVSAAWTDGYEKAQSSAYNETLRGLLILARTPGEVGFMQMVTTWGGNLGRQNDRLMYALQHPGSYKPPVPEATPDEYAKALAEQLRKHPLPPTREKR